MFSKISRAIRIIRREKQFGEMFGVGRAYDVRIIRQELAEDPNFLGGAQPNERGIWLLCWWLDQVWAAKVLWRVVVKDNTEFDMDMIVVWPY
jgi:hypothetical protein